MRDSNLDPNAQVPGYVTGETGKVNMNWRVPAITAVDAWALDCKQPLFVIKDQYTCTYTLQRKLTDG